MEARRVAVAQPTMAKTAEKPAMQRCKHPAIIHVHPVDSGGGYWSGLTAKSSTTRFCPDRGGKKLALLVPPGSPVSVAVTL